MTAPNSPCALAWVAVLVLGAVAPRASIAGPNSHGTLIVHAVSQLTYSEDLLGIDPGLEACESAVVTLPRDPLLRTVCSVLAAFPSDAEIGYTSVSFGIEYDPGALEILDHASLSEMEISAISWPGPRQGVVLLWLEPRVEPLVEVYRFLVRARADGDLALIPHPADGGRFGVQGDAAWEFDPVSDYGRLGFGTPGYLPCPQPEPSPVIATSWGRIKWNAARTWLTW